MDLLLERRQEVLDGIQERLGEDGFDPATTYRDWVLALQRIAELSEAAEGECVWSAPGHPRDPYQSVTDLQKLLDAIDRWSGDKV